jgi:CelD/BcsL family acetyltransferase involved in cellulose biosynthesis
MHDWRRAPRRPARAPHHRRVVGSCHRGGVEAPHEPDALVWLGAIADEISRADGTIHSCPLGFRQLELQCRQILLDVRDYAVAHEDPPACTVIPRFPGSPLRVEVVEDLDELAAEWTRLGERSRNLFATWPWHSTWWRHFGSGRRLCIAVCRDTSGALVGMMPAYVARTIGPLQLIRLLGHGQGDRLGPICAPEDRRRVGAALQAALREPPWHNALLLAERLPTEDGWTELLGARVLARDASPVVEIAGATWEDVLATRSSSLRKQVRYQERRLEREHALRYWMVEDATALPVALDKLFELHGARWGEEGPTPFAASEAFHREFAARALEHGWLRLWVLEVDGRVAAAWYGFRFGEADWHYQSGRDPSWDRYSVGAVLLAHTIRDSVESGVPRYLFLRGDESYKQRFATADPGLETVAVAEGTVGRAALAAACRASRLPPAARARLVRRI